MALTTHFNILTPTDLKKVCQSQKTKKKKNPKNILDFYGKNLHVFRELFIATCKD